MMPPEGVPYLRDCMIVIQYRKAKSTKIPRPEGITYLWFNHPKAPNIENINEITKKWNNLKDLSERLVFWPKNILVDLTTPPNWPENTVLSLLGLMDFNVTTQLLLVFNNSRLAVDFFVVLFNDRLLSEFEPFLINLYTNKIKDIE
jgi:hypothetical protein